MLGTCTDPSNWGICYITFTILQRESEAETYINLLKRARKRWAKHRHPGLLTQSPLFAVRHMAACLASYCPKANVLAISHQIDLCGKNEETQAPLLVVFFLLLFCFVCQKWTKPFLTYLYLHQKSHDQQSLEMFSLFTLYRTCLLACVLQCIP